jgi:hypothetical protein
MREKRAMNATTAEPTWEVLLPGVSFFAKQ